MARGHPRQATAVRCIWVSSSVCDGAASANGEAASASGGSNNTARQEERQQLHVYSHFSVSSNRQLRHRRLRHPSGDSPRTCRLQQPPPSIDGFWPRHSGSSGAGHSPQGNQATNMWYSTSFLLN
uniref:Uncharacterized protein n=1 Tax=Zea mays TaxID=4577 RepID=A0A804Q8Z1_MAIZE